jgi:ABC-type transport system substrate-binding protein
MYGLPITSNVKTKGALPEGLIYVVDPSPLNWLYILFNTMEEPIRADHLGRIVPSLATEACWLNELSLELKLRRGVYFHDQQPYNAHVLQRSFYEMQQWVAPHPPGTWLNHPAGTVCEWIDDYTVRFHFPSPDGLALGKMRAFHIANSLFWQTLGFGYAKIGSGEGHW